MAGMLHFGRTLTKTSYRGRDGREYYEIRYCDGEREVMSATSWSSIVALFATHGIPRELWPRYDQNIDVPLDDLARRNAQLRDAFRSLGTVECELDIAQRVAERITRGESICYCG